MADKRPIVISSGESEEISSSDRLTVDDLYAAGAFSTFVTALANSDHAIGASEVAIHTRQTLSVRGQWTDTSGTQGTLAVSANDNAASSSSAFTRAVIGQAGTASGSSQDVTSGGRIDGLYFQMQHRGSGTVDDAACILVANGNNSASGTITDMVGLYIDRMKKAHVTNAWGIYQWYSGDKNYLEGKLGCGESDPDTQLHVDGAVTLEEESSTPSNPTSGSQCRMYMKDDKLIIQYNDGGTVRYKYLDLTGTGVTWTHTTTAP